MESVDNIAKKDDVYYFSLSKLAGAFGVSRETVAKRIAHIQPSGERLGHPVWHLRDVASLIESEVLMGPVDPGRLRLGDQLKYYEVQKAKRQDEIECGALVPVDVYKEERIKYLNTLITLMDTLADKLERDVGLSKKHIKEVREWSRETREEFANALEK